MTMENIREQIRELQDMLQKANRASHNSEHNIYRQVSSEEIQDLKEKCMGNDLYGVQFHYNIEFVGRDNGVYVDTRDYGYWKLDEQTNEWTRLDEE